MTVSRKQSSAVIGDLYSTPIPATRTGALYNAFSYPTKISPETVALFIACHTKPGAVVFDPFAGSGSTGIATALCARPTSRMMELAAERGLRPTWGPRSAVLYELSPLGALLGAVMSDPPDPVEFGTYAVKLLDELEAEWGWLYNASSGRASGVLRHAIWSEVVACSKCGGETPYWNAAVRRRPLRFVAQFRCAHCRRTLPIGACERVVDEGVDGLIKANVSQRRRVLVRIYGRSGPRTWSRDPEPSDFAALERASTMPIPDVAPVRPLDWGDLHRSGYHQGITHLHHLYTQRNFLATALLWDRVEAAPEHLRDPLRLLALSFNATHSTLMTRVVVKSGDGDFVVSGAQTGVMYVSGLPVEKNVFLGVRRKIRVFGEAFTAVVGSGSNVEVINASSTGTRLPDSSVDYVFTDPPFGAYIPYAEINEVNEAWLGRVTDRTDEAIVSPAQGKGVGDYANLMKRVFGEVARVMKPRADMTVVFHSSRAEIWRALENAFQSNSLTVTAGSVLDKTQPSFKQVVSAGGTRGDAVLWLRKGAPGKGKRRVTSADEAVATAKAWFPDVVDPKLLFSLFVGGSAERQIAIDIDASSFYLAWTRQ